MVVVRSRHKRLSDYGIPPDEINGLYDMCQHLTEQQCEIFVKAALSACPPGLVGYIIQSLIDGKSYDSMAQRAYIPIGRDDFYGYRRKTLAKFYWMTKGEKESNGELPREDGADRGE